MAIYQPTNIIPSSFTQGTIDVNDNMEISWQVNGNSAMTAFLIDIYRDNYYSAKIYSTGKITSGISTDGFYGTDRFGNPQFFTYNASATWANKGLNNGYPYKYKIMQFWDKKDEVYQVSLPPSGLSIDRGFIVPGVGYISFQLRATGVTTCYYSKSKKQLLYSNSNTNGSLQEITNFTISSSPPEVGDIETATDAGFDYLIQSSFSSFITRTTPTLSIFQTNSNFQDRKPLANTLATSIGYFQAAYNQAQGDAIRWIRWQVATANNGKVDEILEDTGDVYTPTLNFDFNGFFNGQQYAIRAIGESESGQQADTGWIYFTINIENQGQYDGDFTAQCLPKENATLLKWEGVEVITPTANPTNGYNLNNDSSVTLKPEATISWQETENSGAFPFSKPWTVAWKGRVQNYGELVTTVEFSGIASTVSQTATETSTVSGTTSFVEFAGGTVDISGVSSASPNLSGLYEAVIKYSIPKETVTGEPRVDIESFYTSDGSPVIKANAVYDADEKAIIITAECASPSVEVHGKFSYSASIYATTVRKDLREDRNEYSIRVGENVTYYESSLSGNTLSLTLYSNGEKSVSAEISTVYDSQWSATIQKSVEGSIVNFSILSASDNVVPELSKINDNTLQAVLYTNQKNSAVSLTASVTYIGIVFSPQGKLLTLNNVDIALSRRGNPLILEMGNTQLASVNIPNNATSVAAIFSPTAAHFYFYENDTLLDVTRQTISYSQQPLTSVQISGGDSGTTIDSVSVYQGDGSNILSLYDNPAFEPVWNSAQYKLFMSANFNGNIEGGTGTANGNGFRVYRREIGKNVLSPIATVPSTTTSVKDYGISSRKAYKYSLHAYGINGAFMSAVETENVIATNFKNYSLLVCDYDEANDEYHVRTQYLFALNLSAGSVGNNNKPTLNANFTPYPTRMGDTANYASGTLQGLIGAIYTVSALIEQIGNYKRTTKPSTMDYFDSVDLEKELYDLSVAPYQLFLRDMKGHLRMIATSGAISMTTNIKQKNQSISISFPWVEIGDASDVTIIQTPDDYGWNYDNQVLDVQLDVDVETGELSATYPFPYNGTKFYLTGVNKENLTAKTPIGVTPAQFELSDVAEEPDNGGVTATVTVNTENN